MQNGQGCFGIPSAQPVPYSELNMSSGDRPSGGGTVYYFATTNVLRGNALVLKSSDSATGTFIQIKTEAIYSISCNINSATNTAGMVAITVNSALAGTTSTSPDSITAPTRKALAVAPAVSAAASTVCCGWTGRLYVNDVVTFQGVTNGSASTARTQFSICQVTSN